MGFLNPWLLLALGGVGVPILIHLLNRFRQREVEWGAMELLRRAVVMRSRQIQIEDLLLLLLRCLAVALLALAMARPTVKTSGAWWFGQGPDVGLVVAVDASYSMAHRPGVASRFSKAVRRAREVLRTVDPGTPITLTLMGDRPRILLRNVAYDPRRVDKVLKDAQPLPERLNLERCLEQIASLVDELKAPRRECYLITDAQAATWGELSDLARRGMDRIGAAGGLFVLAVPSAGRENLAVTRFELASGQQRRGTLARYVAEVANTGRTPQQAVAVSLNLDDRTVDQKVIASLPPGARKTVPLFARFERAGPAKLSVHVTPDALPTDNVRYAVADVREQVRVLLVDGDPSDKPFRGETGYLATALLPKAGRQTSLKVEKASWPAFPAHRLDEYDVVVLANVPDIRRSQAAALHAFVRNGGGLLITLGDKVAGKLANARLASDGPDTPGPLLPARLGDRTRYRGAPDRPAEGWTIEPAGDHRLAHILDLVPAQLVEAARVEQFFTVELLSGARTILRTGGTERPLLAERSVGHGKVLLLTTTADRDWTNLAIHPIFPILLHEMVGYLTAGGRQEAFTVGEPLTVWLGGRKSDGGVTFRDPARREVAVQVQTRDGERVAQLDEPTRPGIYDVLAGEGAPPMALAVNVDARRESNLACLDAPALAEGLTGLPVRLPADDLDLAEEIRQLRVGKELWRMLMLAGLAVLIVEALLAYVFARRVRAGEQAELAGTRRDLLSGRESEAA